MKFTTKILVLSLIMAGGIAISADATDPVVKARQALMDANGGAMKVLGGMAADKMAFDAVAAEAARATLIADAANIGVVFKNNATDPASKAKPEIWTAWDDFTVKAGDLGTAAAALDTTSLDTLKAGMGAIGGTCKACHTAYKAS